MKFLSVLVNVSQFFSYEIPTELQIGLQVRYSPRLIGLISAPVLLCYCVLLRSVPRRPRSVVLSFRFALFSDRLCVLNHVFRFSGRRYFLYRLL